MTLNRSTATVQLVPLGRPYIQMEAFQITEAVRFVRSQTRCSSSTTGEWVAATKESDHI